MTYQRTLTTNNKGPDPQRQAEHISQVRTCAVLRVEDLSHCTSRNTLTPERFVLNFSTEMLPDFFQYFVSRIPAASEDPPMFKDFNIKKKKKK